MLATLPDSRCSSPTAAAAPTQGPFAYGVPVQAAPAVVTISPRGSPRATQDDPSKQGMLACVGHCGGVGAGGCAFAVQALLELCSSLHNVALHM